MMVKFRKKKHLHYMAALMLVIFSLAGLAGCGAATKDSAPAIAPQEMAEARNMDMAYSMSNSGAPAGAATRAEVEKTGEDGGVVQPAGGAGVRYVILNARLTLEIEDIEETTKEIQKSVKQLGGYVASLEIYDLSRERRAGHMSIRIPQDKYAYALEILDGLGETKNISENTSDVTMNYIDLEARITNLEAQEKRMRELLDRAENMEDILQIEKELGRIRGDLESMTAEFKHLQERVNYSTIDIRLEERDPRQETVVDGFGNFGERIGNLMALNTNRLLDGMANFVIVIIGSLPIIIPLLLLIIILWKAVGAAARKRRAQEQKNYITDIQIPGEGGKK
jgi:TolA-binding protein